ncbi:restriction endonuclease subunit S [Escherichia coli]|uniref:Restriction endonuclease subunit S n=3 Tax=Enterobacteriaceae TaxID=543 RepID=A0A3Z4S4M2_SALET|nr:restriction endonuclease subunit S [Escherichia coli]EAC0193903.1 restriction endonuclease subunit S [Salmonella enterica subsp. enterica serovar Panama]EEK7955750.1 restriction endonuclease subunit S [Salmonella enterica]HAB4598164.1 restriction endonuclease subunit S [Salmonella enterica subsp. enterica]EHJ9042255.1 restriction endonuclease subunit S [Salmonella enterica subsp. enterica serovar Panama]EHJ9046336.1 restriction endonuclease subunit S [Salmonella enterica subsp. enterica ser
MVPKGWRFCKLADISRVTSGGTPNRAISEYWQNGTIPWIRTTEVQNCILQPEDAKEYISELGLRKSSAKLIPENTILLAMIGQGKTRGQIALLKFEAAINQNCAAIIFGKSQEPEFYYHYLLSQYENIRNLSNSAGQSNLSGALVKAINVLVPPYNEQKKIAQILSTWDKAISVTEKLLTNSQQQKKALMQQLLTGKKRLLDENGVRFSTEWEFKRISEIATRVQRKNDAAEHPILTISSLSGFVRQDERYSRYMAGESVKNYILLKKGEFAYNKGNSKTYEFGCIFDLEAYEAGLVPHVYVCFRLKNGLSHRYFKYLFEADYLKPQLGALVNTGVRNNGLLNIKPTEFMQTKVPVPCFEEQESIADMLYNSSRTIRVLQDKLACLKDEKKALMQQLLTGKRRVKVDEAVAV